MRRIFSLSLLMFTMVIILTSCAKKIAFNQSGVVPGASGTTKIKKDKNQNYQLDISIRDLAPSKDLMPSKEYYVVWLETENNGIKNIGQISSSSSLLSRARKASLSTVTPFRPRSIFITAEDDMNIQYPGTYVILKTDQVNLK